jgi:GTPase SAR1 family protein
MSKGGEPTVVHRKVAALGFRGVGKSSLINSFVSGTFSEGYDPTIESTHHKTIRFRKVHFATDIVDTAGMVRMLVLRILVPDACGRRDLCFCSLTLFFAFRRPWLYFAHAILG